MMEHTIILIFAAVGTYVLVAAAIRLYVRLALRRVKELKHQEKLIDTFYDLTARFMRKTNDEEHSMLRAALASLPEAMHKGRLAKSVFSIRAKTLDAKIDPKEQRRAHEELESMDDATQEIFAQALGCALVASTCDLVFTGSAVRRGLLQAIDPSTKEVNAPDQLVLRLKPVFEDVASAGCLERA